MLTIRNPKTHDWAGMALSDVVHGNALDTYFTLKLFDLICEKMEGQPVMKLVEEVIMPSLETFATMEYNGLEVDTTALKSVGKELNHSNMEEEDFLYTCKGILKTDNLASTKDLVEILYTREEGMGLYPPDRTGKGTPSTAAPTIKLLLEYIDAELEKRG